MPTSHSERGRGGAWMHFSDTRCLLGLPHWEVFRVASQLLSGGEISFSKPVLQVRFTKHFPTSLMLTITAPLLPYHGRLCTSFPGINLSKQQISSTLLVRHETRALMQDFVKCFINLCQPQQWGFNGLCPKTPDSDHTPPSMHGCQW